MKTTGLTLSEALALQLPFRHKKWDKEAWIYPDNEDGTMIIGYEKLYSQEWEVKAPSEIKVWHASESTGQFFFGPKSSVEHIEGIKEATPEQLQQLREALGIKDILKDSDNG